MFSGRIEYSCILENVTDLHIGAGEFASFTSERGLNKSTDYAAFVRDCRKRPYIPATAIKGALRRIAELAVEDRRQIDTLFGTIEGDTNGAQTASMGLILVRGGESHGPAAPIKTMPYADALVSGDSFLAARTAINVSTGVAADHLLFYSEMLPTGSRFKVRFTLLDHGAGREPSRQTFEKILQILVRDGLRLGRGQADGQGHLIVSEKTIKVTKFVLGKDGVLAPTNTSSLAAAASGPDGSVVSQAEFALCCEEPFLVADSSIKLGQDTANPFRDKKKSGPQISAQRTADNQPLVLGSSVGGALRARASWLRQVLHIGSGETIDRLFGTTKNRALLEVRKCKVSGAQPFEITSLKIDRFSGAPVDGALFRTAAFVNTRLDLKVVLLRRGRSGPDDDDKALFGALVQDIAENGLTLGAGANKGFGWFVPIEDEARHGSR